MKCHYKTLAAVFLLALVIRLLALEVLLPQMRADVDLDSYRALAQNLAAGKGFVAGAMDGRTVPNVSRTPVYPLFLAALIRLGDDRLGLFLIAQCVVGAATCLLTVVLASRWLSWRCATAAGALVAIDPNSIVRCVDLRTETVFALLLVGGACLLAWQNKRGWGWGLAGLVWSLAALCRPIAVWVWLVALAMVLVHRHRLVYLLIFFAGYFPLECIWATRNAALTGHAFISTISTYNLLMYRGAGVEAERTRQPLEDVQHKFLQKFGDIQFFEDHDVFQTRLRNYREEASRLLFSAPAVAVKQVITGWAKILFGPGAHSIDNMLREPGGASRWWTPLYALALIAVVALSFVGVIRLGREAVLLLAVVVYFVALAGGPESNSRFRAPIAPMLAVLAAAVVCGSEKKE